MTEQQYEECKKAFELLDKNKDGTISTRELEAAMKSIDLNPTKEELKKIIDKVDADKNGSISLAEFQELMYWEYKKPEINQLREVFKSYDTNNDGTITVEEAYLGLKKAGNMSEEDIKSSIQQIFQETDFNKDDKIIFEGKPLEQ